MSRLVGEELTAELFDRLNGEEIKSNAGKAIVVVTTDASGWAHPAMLSYYEIVAKDRRRIDLAIGKNSTTAKNLRGTSKITLLVTDHGVNYYLKAAAAEVQESMAGIPFMSLFRLEVMQVLEDQEPDAIITSGVTFSRPDKSEVNQMVDKIFDGVRRAP